MKIHYINSEQLTFETIQRILEENIKLELSEESKQKITKCRDFLDCKMAESNKPVYGVNTGFGALYNRTIANEDLGKLQKV